MSTPECSASSFLQLTALFVFIGYFLLIIRRYFSKTSPRIVVVDDGISALEKDFSSDEINAILKFKEYLAQIQKLAQKTAEEKACFSEFDKEDNFDQALDKISKKCNEVQEAIHETIEYKQHRTNDQFKRAQKLINCLESEIFIFKNSLVTCSPAKKLIQGRIMSKIHVEENTQTNDDLKSKQISEEGFCLEMLNNDDISEILTAVKDCMESIVKESGSSWKVTTKEISKYLSGNNDDIKKQLLMSADEYLEKNNQMQVSSCESILIQTATVEKLLFDIFLFLDRQMVDAQAVAETLRFFNRKFVHFAQKCDKRWEDSCSNYITTCNRVQEAQENMNFSSRRMSRITYSFSQQAETLKNLSEGSDVITRTVATVIAAGDFGGNGKDQMDAACCSMDELEDRVRKIEEVYRFNMTSILELIEKPGQKLESLLQYIEELGILNDFVKSMISYTSVEARINHSDVFGRNEKVSNRGVTTEQFSFGDTSQTMLENQNKFVEGVSCQRILSMLNDVIKKTASKISQSSNVAVDGKGFKDSWIQNFAEVESKMKDLNIWDPTMSETALSEITSDCLLPKSSGSSADEN